MLHLPLISRDAFTSFMNRRRVLQVLVKRLLLIGEQADLLGILSWDGAEWERSTNVCEGSGGRGRSPLHRTT